MDKFTKYATALFALSTAKLLKDDECKEPVKSFIRRATESTNHHVTAHFRSANAAKRIRGFSPQSNSAYQKFCSNELSHYHIVPVEVIYRMILGCDEITVEYAHGLLVNFGDRATITRDENADLTKAGLRSRMPISQPVPTRERLLSRYVEIGIADTMEKLGAPSWLD